MVFCCPFLGGVPVQSPTPLFPPFLALTLPRGQPSPLRVLIRFGISKVCHYPRQSQHESSPLPPHLRLIAASRRRIRWMAPGPVPVGGFRIPSSSSLSTTALLCCSFFDANRRVRRFFLWARSYSFRRSPSASG